MSEIWKDVVGYEGYYQVSNLGNVRSVTRSVSVTRWGAGRTQVFPGKPIAQQTGTRGYKFVILVKDRDRKGLEVHVLVAKAFLGPRPANHDVHHKDSNPANNRLDNLVYLHKSYHQHITHRGENAPKARLTEPEVKEILKLLAQGKTQKEIAERYHVSRSTIGEINRGASWSWLSR